jgi:hypothetical protein
MAVIQREGPPAAVDAGGKASNVGVEDLVVPPRHRLGVAQHFLGQLDAFGHGFGPSCIRHEAWFRLTIKASMAPRVAGRRRVAGRTPEPRHPLFSWDFGAGRIDARLVPTCT